MAVSLGEIANIKGDADLAQGGFGTDAVLPENNTALAYLSNAANLQAGANKYLAEVHNKRMEDYLSNFHNIDLKNLAPGDYDNLSQQYVDLSKDLADNFDVIQNPFKNPQVAGSLAARESALRSQIAQSQMDKGMMDINQNHIDLHPDLNTAENQQKMQAFWKTPLGQRQPVQLNPAFVYNPQEDADAAYNSVKQDYATATPDGKYIWSSSGTKAALPAYLKAYNARLNANDQYGRTKRQSMLNAFNQLSPDQKAQYNNDPQQFSDQIATSLFKPDQVNKATATTDEYGTQNQEGRIQAGLQNTRLANEDAQNELNRENALKLAGLKDAKGNIDKNAVGEYKNKIYHDFVTGRAKDPVSQADIDAIKNNPNLNIHQKAAAITKLDQENATGLGQNIPNEILQPIYGNNNKTEIGSANDDGSKNKTQVSYEEVIGNRISNNGQAFISLRNNLTGRIHSIYVPLTKFYDDLNNVLGPKYAPLVNTAGREWLQKNTGGVDPDINKLTSHFNPQTADQGPPIVSDKAGYDALQKGAKYVAPDGKTYIKN